MNIIDTVASNMRVAAKYKHSQVKSRTKDKTRARRAMEANVRDSMEWPQPDLLTARKVKVRFVLKPTVIGGA